MICALMIGRAGSTGFPGKNTFQILGRPLCAYPLLAANGSQNVDRVFVSTDCPDIAKVSLELGASLIERPAELATSSALGEDVFVHGYYAIKGELENLDIELEMVVLLFANAATIDPQMIDKGVELLRTNPDADSAVSTSVYNMWSPVRSRKINVEGYLDPFVPLDVFGDVKTMSCDRDSQGDVYFADMSVSVVRPHCLENLSDGLLPQKWMGRKILPIRSWGGCDIDYAWQVPSVEYWLSCHGYTGESLNNA